MRVYAVAGVLLNREKHKSIMNNVKQLLIPILLTGAVAFLLTACNDQGGTQNNQGGTQNSSTGSYPLTTCVVSGEDLYSMGKPHVINYKGTTVKFCCKSCVDDFNSNPEKYLAKIR